MKINNRRNFLKNSLIAVAGHDVKAKITDIARLVSVPKEFLIG